MNMKDYTKILAEHIPMPTTIQQALLVKNMMKLNESLKERGLAHLEMGCNDGSRSTLCAMARNLRQLYLNRGYKVDLYEYSQSRKDRYFSLIIEIDA